MAGKKHEGGVTLFQRLFQSRDRRTHGVAVGIFGKTRSESECLQSVPHGTGIGYRTAQLRNIAVVVDADNKSVPGLGLRGSAGLNQTHQDRDGRHDKPKGHVFIPTGPQPMVLDFAGLRISHCRQRRLAVGQNCGHGCEAILLALRLTWNRPANSLFAYMQVRSDNAGNGRKA